MPMTPKEIGKLLRKNGFTDVKEGARHTKYTNPNTGIAIMVPRHAKELPTGMEKAILKQAGLK